MTAKIVQGQQIDINEILVNGQSRRVTNIWKSHKTVIVKHHEAL